MRVTIFGSGYVGLVTGACLAEVGHNVVCMDVDSDKIEALKQGQVPIYEPGLTQLIQKNLRIKRLVFTTNVERAVAHGSIQFIAVGTPPDEDGSADLQYVLQVAENIGRYTNGYKLIVNKSTVPVGTADKVKAKVQEILEARGETYSFDVVSNPEFLKEGAAIDDFMRPDRIVIGTDNQQTIRVMSELYAPFNRNHNKLLFMDVRSSEMTKYAANAMLATKISFMNEMAQIAEKVGADIEQVRVGIGSDSRIGFNFIYPGCGYGGSCFPKDVKALQRTAKDSGLGALMLDAVEEVNFQQKRLLFKKIHAHYEGQLQGKRFALWGLAFKPNTDDMREASSRVIMEALWEAGASIQAFDPEAMQEAQRIYGQRDDFLLCETPEDALENADALILVTEWRVFQSPDFEFIREKLQAPVVFDGRNLFDPRKMHEIGFDYYAIGRGKAF